MLCKYIIIYLFNIYYVVLFWIKTKFNNYFESVTNYGGDEENPNRENISDIKVYILN